MSDYALPSSREPAHRPGTTATARVIEELQLYGYHPGEDEPDPRPLPETPTLENAISGIFEIIAETFGDTRLEPDTSDVMWHMADIFHRKAARVQAQLDDNEIKQRACQKHQDGSEIQSVELEKLLNQGLTIMERRNVFEHVRDLAGEQYEALTGSSWRPRSGSLVNRKKQTAAMVDSRDFLSAKKIQETTVMIPPGTRIAFTGGTQYQNTETIWAVLDKVLARYPDMVLMHGNASGADTVAKLWARSRKVTEKPFDPEWLKYRKASVFKRNDEMLAAEPMHLIAFPGTGITDNMVDKAKKLGIPVADYRGKTKGAK